MTRRLLALVLFALATWAMPALADTPSQAMASCQAYIPTYLEGTSNRSMTCADVGTGGCGHSTLSYPVAGNGQVCGKRFENGQPDGYLQFQYTMPVCASPEVYSTVTHACHMPCDQAPDTSFLGWNLQPFDEVCHNGCQYAELIGGGQSSVGTECTADAQPVCGSGATLLSVSGAPSGVCRPTDTDEDGIPDVSDDFPNDPGEDTDSDGDGIGDNGDHKPDDPTNGKDEDEEGGDEGDNVSTGGGNCTTRPDSSGDAILAQIAYQTWATRCAIERSQASDGSINVKGAGGSIAIAGGGTGTDLSMGDSTPEALGDPANGGAHPGVDTVFEDSDLNATIAAGPSETGIGSLSRTCPLLVLPNLEMSFGTVTMPWTDMCGWLDMLAGLIVLAGTIQWAFILGRIGT